MHVISQWRATSHAGSPRHAAASAQQKLAMQSPHVVRFVGQGLPQLPALHSWLQHCEALLHIAPS
jgi:hypothetical protein